MQGYLKRIYSKLTLHQKVRLTILAFSILPLICLACISLSFIYKNRIEKIHDEVYEEMQNRFQDMNYSMSTMEIMGKTIWSNTTFITEIGKAALNGDLKGYNRYIFQDHTLSILRVVTSVSQVRGARIYLDYPGLREYPPYLYRMDRAEVNRWYEDRDSLRYDGAWYMNVTEQQIYGTYSDYYLGTGMAAYVFPLRITSNLTGIFEIVLPMEAVVPDIFDDTGKRDVFLIDEKGQFHGVNKELIPGGFDTEDLAKLMGVSALKDYKENGIQL